MRAAADKVFVLEAINLQCLDGNDIVGMLKTASDEEKGFLGDHQAKSFKHRRSQDCISDTGFILEADKYKTLGGSGTLPANNIPGNAHNLVMTRLWKIGRAPDVMQLRPY